MTGSRPAQPGGRHVHVLSATRPERAAGTGTLRAAVFEGPDRIVLAERPTPGKERMRTLMALVRHGRIDLSKLITHRFGLDEIEEDLRRVRQPARRRRQVAITP